MKLHVVTLVALGILSQFTPTLTHVMTGQNTRGAVGQRLTQPRTGVLTGTVTDRSGAALVGVTVIIMSPDGDQWEGQTDKSGRYRVYGIRPGRNYSITVVVTGLSVTTVSDITVKQKGNTTVPIQLGFGPTPTPSPLPSPKPTQIPTPRPSPLPSPRPTQIPTPRPSPLPSVMPTPRPTPRASPSPGATPSPNSTDWETLIRNEAAKLNEGKITFNPPAEMQEQKTEIIQARISFKDIGPTFFEGLEGPGPPQEEPLKVSEIMTVTLTGDRNAFLIQRIGDEEQVVAGKPYAQWEWHVTPLQSGDQRLTLTATAKIFLPGRGEKPVYYKALEQPIVVHVDRWYTTKQFITNNWQWLWAVVIVPLAGLLWGIRRRKTRRAGFR